MSPRAQVLGIFLKKGLMSLHLRHIYPSPLGLNFPYFLISILFCKTVRKKGQEEEVIPFPKRQTLRTSQVQNKTCTVGS